MEDTEKKELVLDTLKFLVTERNKTLFRLNALNGQRGAIEKAEKYVIKSLKNLRIKITKEIEQNSYLLTQSEKEEIFSEPDEEDDGPEFQIGA